MAIHNPHPVLTVLQSGSYLVPGLAAIVVAAAFGVAWAVSREDVAALRWMAAAPRASLAAPREGPAVYAGELVGPAGRVTAAGRPAAAYWWWVEQRVANRWRPACAEAEHTLVSLRDGAGLTVPLMALDGSQRASLLADDHAPDWTGRLVFDLGRAETTARSDALPARASRCGAARTRYTERWIPAGARVEVLACHRAGVLRACGEGAPHGLVLAVGGLKVHAGRRARGPVGNAFRAAAAASLLALLAASARLLFARAAAFGQSRRARGSR